MPLFDFHCACGWVGERLVGRDAKSVPCPDCSQPATKAVIYRISQVGEALTPLDQRTYFQEFKDFTEASAELEYRQERINETAGREVKLESPAVLGQKKAQALMKKGVTSSEDWMRRKKGHSWLD